MRGATTVLEGKVLGVYERSLIFETTDGDRYRIPLSQVNDAANVAAGDHQIEITQWMWRKLSEEGPLS